MDPDTSIGGTQHVFPETRHSAILNLRSNDAGVRECASGALIEVYWKPAYKYIRVRWNRSNEDAKDLTQAFFTRNLEKEFFRAYDPLKARFRTYLRACLDAFVSNANKAAGRIKRGGHAPAVRLDFETAEGELRQRQIASGEPSPEDYFHREWVRNLFSLAVEDLKRESGERGNELPYRLFERYDLNDGERPTYARLALEFDLPATTVTNYLAAQRRRLRRLVLDRIRETTASDREFQTEVRTVLGIEA
jgi:DNA-directed RNA polymerase specialized sigma24 family protein